MLLLWLRVAALALAATGGPVPASPPKTLDNGLSCPRTIQVTPNSTGLASKVTPIPIPPTISLLSGKLYYPDDTVSFKWDLTALAVPMPCADLWIAYSVPFKTVTVFMLVTRDVLLPPDYGSMVLPSAYVIPWKELLGYERKGASVTGCLYFVYSPSHYRHDVGVSGVKCDPFTIQHR